MVRDSLWNAAFGDFTLLPASTKWIVGWTAHLGLYSFLRVMMTNFPQPQTYPSPLIVDDTYDVAETVALGFGGGHRGGLLAKADYQGALLSMSGSVKDVSPIVHGTCYLYSSSSLEKFCFIQPAPHTRGRDRLISASLQITMREDHCKLMSALVITMLSDRYGKACTSHILKPGMPTTRCSLVQ